MKLNKSLLASVLSISLLAPITVSPYLNSNVASASEAHKAFSYKEARKIVEESYKHNKDTLQMIKSGINMGSGPEKSSRHNGVTKISVPFGANSYLVFSVKNMGSYAKISLVAKGIGGEKSSKVSNWSSSQYKIYGLNKNSTVNLN